MVFNIVLTLTSLLSAQLSFAARPITLPAAFEVFKQSHKLNSNSGHFDLGSCEIEYSFKYLVNNESNLRIEVRQLSSASAIIYDISSSSDKIAPMVNSVNEIVGFRVIQSIGLDCESAGCINYDEINLIVKPGYILIEGHSDYDPIHYAYVRSVSCQ